MKEFIRTKGVLTGQETVLRTVQATAEEIEHGIQADRLDDLCDVFFKRNKDGKFVSVHRSLAALVKYGCNHELYDYFACISTVGKHGVPEFRTVGVVKVVEGYDRLVLCHGLGAK